MLRYNCCRGSRMMIRVIRRNKSSIASVNKLATLDERRKMKYEKRKDIDINRFQIRKSMNDKYMDSIKDISTESIRESWNSEGNSFFKHVDSIPTLRAQQFHYHNAVEADVMGMVTDMVNTALAELNLRKFFMNDIKDSKLLIQDVGNLVLRNKEVLEQLSNKPEIERILSILAKDPSFAGLNHFRRLFCYNKSGEYLNYEESETTRFTKSPAMGYTNRFSDDKKLIRELDIIFSQSTSDQLSNLDMVFKVINQLINCQSPPGIAYFTTLLDHLDNLNLINYQTILLKYMVPNEFKSSLLALENPLENNLGLVLDYYKSVIEKHPDFINTLFNYYHKLGNENMIEMLLSLLKLDEVIDLERIFNKSIYSQLLSKSRFIKNRNLNRLVPVDYKTPVIINYQTLFNVINKCVEHEKYEYVDLLINKLILYSNSDRGIILSINQSLDLSNFKFVIDNDNEDVNEVLLFVFDRDLMTVLLQLILISNDMGRLMWLIPNLDAFVGHHLDRKRLLELKQYVMNSNDKVFELNKSLQVNLTLIYYIYQCLKQFGLDGKILHYEELFGIDCDLILNNSFILPCK